MNPWERLQSLPSDEAERLKERAKHYKALFESTEGQFVLEDLKVQFFFYDTTADPNPTLRDLKEGNRQVVLSILHALSLDTTPEQQPQENENE
jgi:hypothetical protein